MTISLDIENGSQPDHASVEASVEASVVGKDRWLLNRFVQTRVLSHGDDRATWLGTDKENGTSVVIKTGTWTAHSASVLTHLTQELDTLQRFDSNAAEAVIAYSCADGQLVLVRPFLPGAVLRTLLRSGPLEIATTLIVGESVLASLERSHRVGIQHGAVCPSNIVLENREREPQAALVNCGYYQNQVFNTAIQKEPLETARYLSPEQAGTLARESADTSDLYSTGIVLFECLTGRTPFESEDVGTLLRQHMTESIPDICGLRPEVPRALNDMIQRMLRKDPRDRYQSAAAILFDLRRIHESLRSGVSDPDLIVGACDRRHTLTEPAFVAREKELSLLDAELDRLATGRGRTILIESESGGGKSRLLEELTTRAVRQNATVLRGQGIEEVGQQPFQIMGPILDELVRKAQVEPEFAADIAERLGDHRHAIYASLPELGAAFGCQADESLGPETFGETRTVHAMAALIDALGSPARPTLLILDDCQWSDELTLKLLKYWTRKCNGETPGSKFVSVVAGFRSEDVHALECITDLECECRLRLEPLQEADLRRMVESMSGPLPPEALETVCRLAGGSPFMASAVLRGMVETNALIAEESGWRVVPLAMADLQSSDQAATVLSRRIDLLPDSTLQILSAGAVAGKEFDLELAAQLAGQSLSQAINALGEARHRHLVWTKPDGTRCAFVHDRVRSALLARLEPEHRMQIHLQAAQYIQQHNASDVFQLAYHFHAAEAFEYALPNAIAAAERSRAVHSLKLAEQFYRIARECIAAPVDDEDRAETNRLLAYQVAEGLGDVLLLRGRYDEAAELFRHAATLAEDAYEVAQVQGKLGELAFKRGDMERAALTLEQALHTLGVFVPRSPLPVAFLMIWEIVIQAGHTLWPRWPLRRRSKSLPKTKRLSLRLLSRLAHAYWFVRGKPSVFWAHLRGLNVAERYEPSTYLAQAYSEHAPGMSLVGLYGRGIRYAELSLQIRRQLGDVWGQGQSLHFHGVVLYAASRYSECIDKCREAVRLLERTGDYWEVHIARYQIAASLYRLGDLSAALKEARRIHASGLELGDEQASGISLDVWSRASLEQLEEGILRSELERFRPDAQGKAQLAIAKGVHLLHRQKFQEATEAFDSSLQTAREAGVWNAYVAPAFAWLATAQRTICEREGVYAPDRRRHSCQPRALSTARRARRAAGRYRNDLPHALREEALLLAMLGRFARARGCLMRSLREAERQEAAFELVQSLDAYRRIGQERGWTPLEGNDAFNSLAQKVCLPSDSAATSNHLSPSLSLLDRFDAVLETGRAISSAWNQADVYEQLIDAAVRLLRAERCLILHVEKDAPPSQQAQSFRVSSGEPATRVCVSHIEQALCHRRAIAFSTRHQAIHDEQQFDQAGSALCAPIFVRGDIVACIYVTHEHVHDLFSDNEERIANFITTLAGAALENADGFQKLQTLNATLEERVQERTEAAEKRAQELTRSNKQLAETAAELRQTDEQLRVAKDLAEAASEAKSQFLAAMSHEIRTPMNGILGMTELALATELTDGQRGYLRLVKQSANALLRLIDDILDFSKIEAGKLELERIAFDVRDLLTDALRVLAPRADEKQLPLLARVAPNVDLLHLGDPGRLRQIIINLVGNAIKFTDRGHILVEIEQAPAASRPGQDTVELTFRVHDSGIGIPPEKQQTIFESFCQADSSTTRRFGGTGLGLAICAQLVHLMQGAIDVESTIDEGSTFTFRIPLSRPVPAGDKPTAATPRKSQCLKGYALGVVDPNPLSRQILVEQLVGFGADFVDAEFPTMLNEDRTHLNWEPEWDYVIIDTESISTATCNLLHMALDQGAIRPEQVITVFQLGQSLVHDSWKRFPAAHCINKPLKMSELIAVITSEGKRGDAEATSKSARETEDRPLRILLAEDGETNQEVAVGLLEMQGHRVVLACNGQEAVDAFATAPYDIILMDLEMPIMDGLRASQLIRERESIHSDRRTPIVAMTAHAVDDFRTKCFQAGMDAFIAKPIQPDELYDVLLEFADAGRKRPAEI